MPILVERIPLHHRVLAILSFASKRGKHIIPSDAYFELLGEVVGKHPEVFPGLKVSVTAFYAYSKQLDTVQQQLIGSAVDVLACGALEITKERANQSLTGLRELYGDEVINGLEPLSATLVEAMNKQQ